MPEVVKHPEGKTILERYTNLKSETPGRLPDIPALTQFIHIENAKAFVRWTDTRQNGREAVKIESLEFYKAVCADYDEAQLEELQRDWPDVPFIIDLASKLCEAEYNNPPKKFPYNQDIKLTEKQACQCQQILDLVFKYQDMKVITLATGGPGDTSFDDQLQFAAGLDDEQILACKWLFAAWIRAAMEYTGVMIVRIHKCGTKDIVFAIQFLPGKVFFIEPERVRESIEGGKSKMPESNYIMPNVKF